jgi:hypothetical protein
MPWTRGMMHVRAFTLRDDHLRPHSMAHAIVNGASLTVGTQDDPFVDQVSDVLDQIDHYVAELLSIREVPQPLESVRPDDLADFDEH